MIYLFAVPIVCLAIGLYLYPVLFPLSYAEQMEKEQEWRERLASSDPKE